MPTRKKPLTIRQILKWADAHYRRTGRWPSQWSGKIKGASGETWSGINVALRKGGRGFNGGSSLSRLLAQRCGKPPGGPRRARLTIKQILAWADEHHHRTGRWPSASSGRIPGSNGERAQPTKRFMASAGLPFGAIRRQFRIGALLLTQRRRSCCHPAAVSPLTFVD
jgi:hypothetical protein